MKAWKPSSLMQRRMPRTALVLSLVALPILLSLLGRDAGLLALIIATVALVAATALVVGSQVMLPLPLPTLDDRINAFLAFLGWLLGLNRASYLVEDVTIKRTTEPGTGMLPGVIVVDGHSAVLTKRFQHYLRVLGPGTHFTVPFERVPVVGGGAKRGRVREVVDLRKQMRFLPVTAQTKDGLTVKTAFLAQFYIDRDPDPQLDKHHMYRFYEQAVQKAVMSERVGEKPDERYDWTSLPAALGSDLLLHIISTYTLDELYAPRSDDPCANTVEVRKKIREELTSGLRDQLREHGIYLIFAGCAKFTPADVRVTQQRIDAWRASRERQIKIDQAYAIAAADSERELSRGQAERDMILRIMQGLQAIPSQYYDSLVPLRLITALEVMFGSAEEERASADKSSARVSAAGGGTG